MDCGFQVIDNLDPKTIQNYQLLDQADSIVIDPHKHGLQPYGCGCVLFSDPNVAKYYLHDSPYTYYTSDELHLGEISLECSRAGASAVGLWATHQMLPPVKGGEFSKDLSKSRETARRLYDKLDNSAEFTPIVKPETDIVVWYMNGKSTKEMSDKANQLFKRAEEKQLYLSLYKYPTKNLKNSDFKINTEYLTCLRSCLMKPQHADWLEEIWKRMIESIAND